MTLSLVFMLLLNSQSSQAVTRYILYSSWKRISTENKCDSSLAIFSSEIWIKHAFVTEAIHSYIRNQLSSLSSIKVPHGRHVHKFWNSFSTGLYFPFRPLSSNLFQFSAWSLLLNRSVIASKASKCCHISNLLAVTYARKGRRWRA